MLVEIETADGPRKVRVCNYCRSVCIPSGGFCSGRCARLFDEFCAERFRQQAMSQRTGVPPGSVSRVDRATVDTTFGDHPRRRGR